MKTIIDEFGSMENYVKSLALEIEKNLLGVRVPRNVDEEIEIGKQVVSTKNAIFKLLTFKNPPSVKDAVYLDFDLLEIPEALGYINTMIENRFYYGLQPGG